jgi:hypothetical protein
MPLAISCASQVKHGNKWLKNKLIKNFENQKTILTFALLSRQCRVGQGVKTPPFHGGITGSIPVRGTIPEK